MTKGAKQEVEEDDDDDGFGEPKCSAWSFSALLVPPCGRWGGDLATWRTVIRHDIWQPGEQSSAMTGCLAHDYLFCIFTHLSVISVFILFFSPTRMLLECVNASGGTAFAGTLVSTIWDPDGEEQLALGVGGMVFMHYLS